MIDLIETRTVGRHTTHSSFWFAAEANRDLAPAQAGYDHSHGVSAMFATPVQQAVRFEPEYDPD
jgi:hypothetical protein